ncbi:MAG: DMT family transporter [Ruminococcaceae bacterium]|nr:DMT family transporter [Oscillospiraceae bacterium]
MNIILYLLNVVCASGQVTLSKVYSAKGGKAHIFDLNKAIAGIFVFLIMGLVSGMSFHIPTVFFGIGYGVFLGISMFTGFKALKHGPMALTSIIASFSLIIPFIFGITVWDESITVYGVIGIILLLCAIVLLNFKSEKGITVIWSVLVFSTMVSNGVCSLIQKYHQLYFPKAYRIEFMIWSLLCVLIVTSIMGKSELKSFKFNFNGIVSGILNGSANFIVLYLSATENASVLFPIVSVCNVVAVWLIGRIAFRERLKLIQAVGLIFGVVAVMLLSY